MTWTVELEELRRREAMAREMGGPDKVRRQHDGGRLTVRERVEALVDRGSFHEVGAIAGRAEYDAKGDLQTFTPSNCVMGRAMVDGRPVVVVGDDFTVRGGSADATIREKPIMAERMAAELRLPIIRMIEGSGGGGSVKTIETTGRANLPGGVGGTQLYYQTTANLGLVPVVSGFLGPTLDVRHVTLSTGQLGAASATLGLEALHLPAFWWAAASLPLLGALNVTVSFYLAFSLALRAQNVSGVDRSRIYAAIRARLRTAPLQFFVPKSSPAT